MKVFFMCKSFYLLHSQLVIEDALRCVGASPLFDQFHRREIGVFEVYKFTMFFWHVYKGKQLSVTICFPARSK